MNLKLWAVHNGEDYFFWSLAEARDESMRIAQERFAYAMERGDDIWQRYTCKKVTVEIWDGWA